MWFKVVKIISILLVVLSCFSQVCFANGVRFRSDWKEGSGSNSGTASCRDIGKKCIDSGYKVIDGIRVHKSCWKYAYQKKCDYPSKNDCVIYDHCYPVGDKDCLIRDSAGNCVNIKREFSCESWEIVSRENQTVRMGLEAKDGPEGLVCKGMPCIDGNCVNKSYETNGEMMDSISRLYSAKMCQPDKDGNFNLFQGSNLHCSKKPLDYKNCCGIGEKGWGGKLGAGCKKDEHTLLENRRKNLCVYVGKVTTGTRPAHVNKHHFCCFGNMLDKVVQVQGRAQLGKSFGSGSSPDCRGLTLEEIQAIDFNKLDFTEFIEDFKAKFAGSFKQESIGDVKDRIEGQMTQIRDGDDNTSNPENNFSGWHESHKIDSDAVKVE